jgi:hypothetical protein
MTTEERKGINWVQVTAAALAAVSSAVVLSTLGVAGTMIGAAHGSVTASLGAAVYSRTIDASRQQVASQAAALKRVAHARLQMDDAVLAMNRGAAGDTNVIRARANLSQAQQALEDAESDVARSAEVSRPAGSPVDGQNLDEPAEDHVDPLFHAEAGKSLPWKRVALVAAGVFVIAMIVISGFELLTGRAVSSYTGGSSSNTGSTVPGLGGGSKPAATPSSTPSQQPSSTPTQQPPSPSSSPTPSASTSPTPTPPPSPTLSPVPSGSGSPTPLVP